MKVRVIITSKKYSEGHTWKSAPYKGEIYKGQEKFRGLNMKKFWR